METLFRWIHLSDIHVGHGDTTYKWDQRLVMAELLKDVEVQVRSSPAPPVDAVFVTGDIANTGAGRSPDEYERAETWLLEIGRAAGVSADRIFVVPGNHDVDRGADKDPDTKALIDALRDGSRSVDDALANTVDRGRLAARQEKYVAFSRRFAKVSDPLHWSLRIDAPSGLAVRVIGLNTALLAADDTDQGKLRVGLGQIGSAFEAVKDGELVLVLGHHPLRDGWLADQAAIEPWIKRRAHAILTGHVHEADAEGARSGAGGMFLRVVAGSVHGDRMPPGVPAGHGYSFGAVVREGSQAGMRITPRKWSAKNAAFRPDVDNTPEGQAYSDHELPATIALPAESAAAAKPGVKTPDVKVIAGEPVSIFVSGSKAARDVELRDSLLKHLKPLKRQGKATFTHSDEAPPGKDRAGWIQQQIDTARVILLLISKDYIGDDDYYEDQLLRALERHEKGEARVVPVLLRKYNVDGEPFAGLRMLPRDDQPIERSPPAEDDVLAEIAAEMRKLCAQMRGEA